jgi:Leucine-rich repeat (LRR) protein
VIPEIIGKLNNLVDFGLHNTGLSGFIRFSLGNLTQLSGLYAYYGNLEGPIPPSLRKLKNLFVLDLSRNQLNGSITREFKASFIFLLLGLIVQFTLWATSY